MKTLSTPRWAVLGMALLTTASAMAQTYQWHKQFTGNSPNLSTFEDMAVDVNGNVYVVGSFIGTINFGGGPVTADFRDFYVAKYNASGTLQFFRKIGKPGANAIVQGFGVSLFNSGGNTFLYVSGDVSNTDQVSFHFEGNPIGNLAVGPNGTVFIAKYNVTTNNPTFEWVRGVNKTQDISNRPKIATDGAGSAYTVASIGSSSGVIIKHNINGDFQWQKSTTGIVRDVVFRNSTTSVVVCGTGLSIASGKAMARLNATNGNTQATLSDDQHDLWSVAVDNAGDIYTAGYQNASIAKIQKLTGQVWTRSFAISFSSSIDIDFAGPSQSEVIVAGWFSGTVNFNNGSNPAFTLTSTVPANHDIFAARYSASSGTCQWVRSYPANQAGGSSNALSAKGRTQHFLIGGIVHNRTIDVDFCQGVASVAADNAHNGFIAQYSLLASPSVSITGADFVCTQASNQTVSASGGITWSVTPANLVVYSNGSGATANLQAVSGVEGQATLTFTFNGAVDGCGMPITGTLNKTLWVGTRKLTGFISVVVDPWLRRILALVEPVPGATGYEWYLNGVKYTGPGMNSDYVAMPISGSCSIPSYTVGVKALNPCGASATYSEVHANPCYGGGFLTYYPNPATDMLVLETSSTFDAESLEQYEAATREDQTTYPYSLYDLNRNRIVLQGTVKGKTEVDVTSLSKGRYVLKIQLDKGKEEIHHLLIDR